jgi:N-acetylglucosaminyldiphosphoundecaprenol N-acetyl-beta-D-mannosaminyltransferase
MKPGSTARHRPRGEPRDYRPADRPDGCQVLTLAEKSDDFAQTIARADFITADGWPIVSLLRSRGIEPQRVTGSEFLERMLAGRAFAGKRAAILGSDRAVGDILKAQLHEAGLKLVVREHGNRREWSADRLAERLARQDVDLLIVAVTPPFGDMIGEEVRRAGFDGVVVNVGGAVNMVTGQAQMAPGWARQLRVEWLYRLAQEPRRLFRRYIVDCMPVFVRHIAPTYLRHRRLDTPA